jgi:5-methylcytosine-specific restriction endonuclease McrA
MHASSLDGARVLILNSSWEPIRIVCWQRAMLLYLAEKVEVIENYDFEAHSPSQAFIVPAVARMISYLGRRIPASPRFSREHIFMRDDYKCQYCNETFHPKELTLDHVVPVVRGGRKTWTNIVTSCVECNQAKGPRTPREAGLRLVKVPKEPAKGFLPDVLHYKQGLPESWKPYLQMRTLGAI